MGPNNLVPVLNLCWCRVDELEENGTLKDQSSPQLQQKRSGNQTKTNTPTVNFRENADFLPIGLALLVNRGKTPAKSSFNSLL